MLSFAIRPLRLVLLCACLALTSSAIAQKNIQLNIKNGDLRAFVETVSKITGKTFVIDPRVNGNVNLLMPEEVDKRSLYEVFLTVMDTHGFAAVPTRGTVLKIVPKKAQGETVGLNDMTRVFSLSHVKAESVMPTLKPLLPAGSQVAAVPQGNLILITGDNSDVARAVAVLKRIDQANNGAINVIRLQNASAKDIATTVSTLIGAENPNVKVIADERTNSILLQAPARDRVRFQTLIAHLDTPIETGGDTEVMYLKYADATAIAEVLNSASESIKATVSEEDGIVDYESETKIDIRAEKNTNALIITASPAVMRNIKHVIKKLDIRRAQVLVEAIITEMTIEDAKELGVQWYGSGSGNVTPAGVINFNNSGKGAASIYQTGKAVISKKYPGSIPAGMLLGLGNNDIGVLLNALQSKTRANILSTPSLMVMDNEEAEFIVGKNVPYVTGNYSDGSSGKNPFQTIKREDVGLKLKVKPQINEGDAISLDIYQEVSNIEESANQATQGPTTSKRALKTAVIVENEQILVLGGLIDAQQANGEQKVPVLGDIPLVGGLFRSSTGGENRRHLMIFLRPKVLRDRRSANFATEQKYTDLRNAQLARGLSSNVTLPPQNDNTDVIKRGALPPVYERSQPLSD